MHGFVGFTSIFPCLPLLWYSRAICLVILGIIRTFPGYPSLSDLPGFLVPPLWKNVGCLKKGAVTFPKE
jgi:hypothetical protein